MRREDESLVQIFYSSQSKMIFCVREEGKRFERKRLWEHNKRKRWRKRLSFCVWYQFVFRSDAPFYSHSLLCRSLCRTLFVKLESVNTDGVRGEKSHRRKYRCKGWAIKRLLSLVSSSGFSSGFGSLLPCLRSVPSLQPLLHVNFFSSRSLSICCLLFTSFCDFGRLFLFWGNVLSLSWEHKVQSHYYIISLLSESYSLFVSSLFSESWDVVVFLSPFHFDLQRRGSCVSLSVLVSRLSCLYWSTRRRAEWGNSGKSNLSLRESLCLLDASRVFFSVSRYTTSSISVVGHCSSSSFIAFATELHTVLTLRREKETRNVQSEPVSLIRGKELLLLFFKKQSTDYRIERLE